MLGFSTHFYFIYFIWSGFWFGILMCLYGMHGLSWNLFSYLFSFKKKCFLFTNLLLKSRFDFKSIQKNDGTVMWSNCLDERILQSHNHFVTHVKVSGPRKIFIFYLFFHNIWLTDKNLSFENYKKKIRNSER